MKRLRRLAAMTPSRRWQWLRLKRDRLVTATLHAARLRHCGKSSIVQRPLFWTPEFVELGADVLVWPGCRLEGVDRYGKELFQPRIVLGDGVTMQQNCHLTAAGTLVIGAGTTITPGVVITDIDHDYETLDMSIAAQPLLIRPTSLGRNCFIGAGARIQAGTRLGDQCVVGANAVVRGTFPDRSVIAGVPARIVKRFDAATGTWRRTDNEGRFV